MGETLRLKQPAGSRMSLTAELRFVDKAGRYILQQKIKIKLGTMPPAWEWRDVELVKEPGK